MALELGWPPSLCSPWAFISWLKLHARPWAKQPGCKGRNRVHGQIAECLHRSGFTCGLGTAATQLLYCMVWSVLHSHGAPSSTFPRYLWLSHTSPGLCSLNTTLLSQPECCLGCDSYPWSGQLLMGRGGCVAPPSACWPSQHPCCVMVCFPPVQTAGPAQVKQTH